MARTPKKKTARAKKKEKMIKVKLKWSNVSPDPNQYKPYNPHFEPVYTFVEIEVPESMVVLKNTKTTVLTPDGMAYVCKQLSVALRRAWGGK